MTDIDFYVDFITTAEIDGLGLRSPPEEWERLLGSNHVDNVGKGTKGVDYGLVELSFGLVDKTWLCNNITIQTQRLRFNRDGVYVPRSLVDRYGDFSPVVSLSEVAEKITTINIEVEPISRKQASSYEQHYVPKTHVIIHSIPSTDPPAADGVQPGSIWNIKLSEWTRSRPS